MITCTECYHVNRPVDLICLALECKNRLLCALCLRDHQNHGPIVELGTIQSNNLSKLNWNHPEYRHILQFLEQNTFIDYEEIKQHVTYMIDQFIREVTMKLECAKEHLIQTMTQSARQAEQNVEYLRQQFIKTFDLQEINVSINKYQSGIYTRNLLEEIIKNQAINMHGNTEIYNIYNYLTQDGLNHNYLDLIQIDIAQLNKFKNKILSYISKPDDFEQLIPSRYIESTLPMKNNPNLTWQLINSFNETKQISKIPKCQRITTLKLYPQMIQIVLNETSIQQFKINGQYHNTIHKCNEHDFYLALLFVNQYTQMFTLWSESNYVQIYSLGKKIKKVKASNNTIKEIQLINKYNLYHQYQEKCLLTLDTQGVVHLSYFETQTEGNYQYEISYGHSIQEIQILPDIRNALNIMGQDSMFDLVVCSYQTNKIKLHVRSLFRSQAISRIQEEESIEARLGLLEHCKVTFDIMKLSSYEKQYLQKQLDINNIDYAVVTLLSNTLTIWNWKTGLALRTIETGESFGMKIFNANKYGVYNAIVIMGLEGRTYCVNWVEQSQQFGRFKVSEGVQIHQLSNAITTQVQSHQANQFMMVIRQIGYPFLVMTFMNYY